MAADRYRADGGKARADVVSRRLADMELVDGMPAHLKKTINDAKKAWLEVSGIESSRKATDWMEDDIDKADSADILVEAAISEFEEWQATKPSASAGFHPKRRTRPVAGEYN